MTSTPGLKNLVLLGLGHAHVQVLRGLAHSRPADLNLTVIAPRPLAVYSGMVLPLRQVYPRRAVTGVQQLRTPLLRLAGASVLIISAPGSRMFLPAVPAAQAGALAHALAEELP